MSVLVIVGTVKGAYFLPTASDMFGPAILRSADLENWKQIVNGPKFEEETGRKLNQIWFLSTDAPLYYAGVDEAGEVRQHVLIYVGDEQLRWIGGLDAGMAGRTSITILQAVSGG